jgi:hypothetical protein
VTSRLQRQYPFDDTDRVYAGVVPEPVEDDYTLASGLTLPEMAQVQCTIAVIRRTLEKHAVCPTKLELIRAMQRSAVG